MKWPADRFLPWCLGLLARLDQSGTDHVGWTLDRLRTVILPMLPALRSQRSGEGARVIEKELRLWRGQLRLRPLNGIGLGVFLTVWTALLGGALAVNGAALPANLAHVNGVTPFTMIGLQVIATPDGLMVNLPIGTEAVAAGIRKGQRLVSIGGRAVGGDRNERLKQVSGPIGTTLLVETVDTAGHRHLARLTRDAVHVREAFAQAWLTKPIFVAINMITLCGVVALFPIGCGIVLLIRRLRDPLAPWASLMMIVFSAAASQGNLWMRGLPEPWSTLALVINEVGFTLFLVVLALFPEGRLDSLWAWAVTILAPVTIVVANNWAYGWDNVPMLALLAMALLAIRARYRAMPAGAGRQQVRWAMLGFAAGLLLLGIMVGSQLAISYAANFADYSWLYTLNNCAAAMSTVLIFGAMTISLLRYRLYDADAAISRSLAYGTLTLGMLGIFAGSEKAIELLGEEFFGERIGHFAGALGAGLAAIMLVPFHHRLTHWAERRFRKQLVQLRNGLPLLMADLRETAGLDRITAAALDRLVEGVHAARAALFVGDDLCAARSIPAEQVRKWRASWAPPASNGLECVRTDPVFPMRVPLEADGHGRVGWLLLGPRPDGSFYGKDERETIAEVADPLARAIEIVRLRATRETAQARELGWLRAELTRLSEQVAGLMPRTV